VRHRSVEEGGEILGREREVRYLQCKDPPWDPANPGTPFKGLYSKGKREGLKTLLRSRVVTRAFRIRKPEF